MKGRQHRYYGYPKVEVGLIPDLLTQQAELRSMLHLTQSNGDHATQLFGHPT